MATRRLMKEHASFEKDPLRYCTVHIMDDDIHHWKCLMNGPEDTPYAGGMFHLDVEFPSQYPFKPPTIKFVTKVYHPAVETSTGRICAEAILGVSSTTTIPKDDNHHNATATTTTNTTATTASSSSSSSSSNNAWGPTLNVRHCLGALYEMLRTPSSFDHSPLEESIATLLRDKPKEFEKNAKKYTKEYAK